MKQIIVIILLLISVRSKCQNYVRCIVTSKDTIDAIAKGYPGKLKYWRTTDSLYCIPVSLTRGGRWGRIDTSNLSNVDLSRLTTVDPFTR